MEMLGSWWARCSAATERSREVRSSQAQHFGQIPVGLPVVSRPLAKQRRSATSTWIAVVVRAVRLAKVPVSSGFGLVVET